MVNAEKIWKIIDIIKVSENALKEKNISNARLNAELILANTLNIKRIDLYLNFDKPLSESELKLFKEKLKRRMHYEPLQYILGFAEFYGLKFKVTPDVLIPRPETELLVDKSLDIIVLSGKEITNILEIGTGSGCIAISIATKCNCIIDSIDISDEAIKIAKENSTINGTDKSINFFVKDIFDEIDLTKYDLIVSNPPYIPADEFISLPEEIKNFEPKYSLTDDRDGLTFYRKFLNLLIEKKIKAPLLLEIGDNKSESVRNLLKEYGIEKYCFYKDYGNMERVLVINQ